MITDRIQLAGLESYFLDTAGLPNLGGSPTIIRTYPLNKGKQLEISGIHLLIEESNLKSLMQFQLDSSFDPSPIFKIRVMKEMFPGLFADPFSHRVHNIAGYFDFTEGTLQNGRVLEIKGIPTIVSSGKEECVWISKKYELPDPISIDAVAWKLAASQDIPADSFHYKIDIDCEDSSGSSSSISFGSSAAMIKANEVRFRDGLSYSDIKKIQLKFTAKVFEDSNLEERHLPAMVGNIGRPLLRAINILEPVQSIYEIHSFTELQYLCSDFHLFENPGPEINRLTATLDLNATLVHSDNQFIHPNNDLTDTATDIYHVNSKYEFIELELMANSFDTFEAKRMGAEFWKIIF